MIKTIIAGISEEVTPFWKRVAYLDVIDSGGKATRIASRDSVYFSFSVNKNKKEQPNPATIEIYNLNDDNLSFIEDTAKYIRLYAGYGDDVRLIFVGNIDDVNNTKDSNNIITKIEAADGGIDYRYSSINKSYPPNTSLYRIIDDLSISLDLPKGSVKDIPNISFKHGYTANGDTKKVLRELCSTYHLNWSIQDGKLDIYNRDSDSGRYGRDNERAFLISSDTGMIGSPEKYKEKDAKKSLIKWGITVKSLLIPELLPGDLIKVKSRFIDRFFIIDELTHSGSASIQGGGTDFYTEIKTSALKTEPYVKEKKRKLGRGKGKSRAIDVILKKANL